MMRSLLARTLALVVTTGLVLAAGASAVDAATPIQPGQHFIGLVNGSTASPTVYTVCPGPMYPGRLGPPAGGQTLAVAEVESGGGYTGPYSQVYAWFTANAAHNGPRAVKFTSYGTKRTIPAQVRVPCDGKGRVEFSSCPYLAPCAYGWIPTYVRVQFVNIANDRR